jgi:hypothetical protein
MYWRAQAFQGSIFGSGRPGPEVTQITGDATLDLKSRAAVSFNKCIVSLVHRAIEARLAYTTGIALDHVARLKPFMTVAIGTRDAIACEHADPWAPVARLDLVTDGCVVHAGIWVEGAPERLLPTLSVQDADTVWSVFVRLLAPPDNDVGGIVHASA